MWLGSSGFTEGELVPGSGQNPSEICRFASDIARATEIKDSNGLNFSVEY
jgi:hypothetical protein